MKGRMRSLVWVSLLAVALLMAIPASAGQFNVDDDSTAADSGWEASIDAAIDSVNAGDTIYVWPGTYSEDVTIDKQLVLLGQVASDAWTQGTPGAHANAPTIDYDGVNAHMICINANGVVFKGFRINCDGAASRGIYFGFPAGATVHSDTIMYCTFDADDTGGSMRYITIADGSTVDGGLLINYCKFNEPAANHSNCFTIGEGGVLTGNNGANTFSYNEVYGSATQMNTSQLRLSDSGNIEDLTYSYNIFEDTDAILMIEFDGYATTTKYFGDILIERNTFRENSSAGADYAFMIFGDAGADVEDDDFEGGSLSSDDVILRYNDFLLDVDGGYEAVSNDVPTPSAPIDARLNYWDAYDGPTRNPGSGADISDSVAYSPWLGDTVGASPMTFHNDSTGLIQDALDSCGVGDTVKVYDGTYVENLTIDDDKVVLIAASKPIIDGNAGTCIHVDGADSVVIWGFTIQNGSKGIYLEDSDSSLVTLNNIKNNAVGGGKGVTYYGIDCDCSSPKIEANDIDSNDVGVYVRCTEKKMFNGPPLPKINFNNIFDNELKGVNNATGGGKSLLNNIVNAQANYWGAADGPGPVGPGSGDNVTANVDYEAWFTDTAKIQTVTNGTVDAKSTADVEVDVEGTADVTVGQYNTNPVGAHTFTGFAGGYIDVHIEDITYVTSITIRFYYPITVSPEISLAFHWWDGANWVLCSQQGKDMTDILPDYGGYLWATITATTTPSLADLLGQPFGTGKTPIVPFYPPIAFVIFAVLIAVATVIYLKRRKLVTD